MAQRDIVERLQVDLGLDVGGGELMIADHEIPFTAVTVRTEATGVPVVTVETIALGGRIHGVAEVVYELSYVGHVATAQGPTVPAALRALAAAIEEAGA